MCHFIGNANKNRPFPGSRFLRWRVAISDRMASHTAAVQQVLCSLSVCVTHSMGPWRLVSYHFFRPFSFARADAENLPYLRSIVVRVSDTTVRKFYWSAKLCVDKLSP